jgi:hypothetical protein
MILDLKWKSDAEKKLNDDECPSTIFKKSDCFCWRVIDVHCGLMIDFILGCRCVGTA